MFSVAIIVLSFLIKNAKDNGIVRKDAIDK
ncbi:MAG: hypothetical protein ACI976_002381 [Aureispira sp.]